jgi:hypothetical protein
LLQCMPFWNAGRLGATLFTPLNPDSITQRQCCAMLAPRAGPCSGLIAVWAHVCIPKHLPKAKPIQHQRVCNVPRTLKMLQAYRMCKHLQKCGDGITRMHVKRNGPLLPWQLASSHLTSKPTSRLAVSMEDPFIQAYASQAPSHWSPLGAAAARSCQLRGVGSYGIKALRGHTQQRQLLHCTALHRV